MSFQKFFLILSFGFLVSCTPDTDTAKSVRSPSPPPSSNKRNSVEHNGKTTVIMISVDGFRADYLQKHKPPTISRLATEGVVADGMKPSFPTNTFPNHISLVTGRTPGRHGIISNFFYDETRKQKYQMTDGEAVNDGSWYKGEPLWVTAEKSGMLAATMFWVGSEADIGGMLATYMKPYDGSVSNMDRSQQIIDWLKLPEVRRPHFLTLYFSDVDSAGHKYGPNSSQVKKAVLDVDAAIAKLVKYTDSQKMDVQYVIVSDHGMHESQRLVNLSEKADLTGFLPMERGGITLLYTDDSKIVESTYQQLKKNEDGYKVYRGGETPESWGFDDVDRRGDIVVAADLGVYLYRQEGPTNQPPRVNKGSHGWNPEAAEMRALFVAHGSKFKKGLKIKPFQNIHVYPMVLEVLDLSTSVPFDGSLDVLRPILQ